MNPRLKTVEIYDNYRLLITFTNGEQGILDLTSYLDKGLFKQLKDIDNFRRFRLVDGVLTWFNGLDISPDTVYLLKSEIMN